MEETAPPADRRSSVWRWPAFLLVSLASVAGWVLIRLPMARAIHDHQLAWCGRLDMLPSDPPCRIGQLETTAIYLVASAFVTLAVSVPTIVLARRGRRALAFVPMLLPLAIALAAHASSWAWTGRWVPLDRSSTSQPFLGPWQPLSSVGPVPATWHPDDPIAVAVDLLLVAAPVVASILLFRVVRPPRNRLGARGIVLACVIAAGTSAVIELSAQRLLGGGLYLDGGGWFLRSIVIVAFALLLPLERRRPLWTIAPVAILLSFGIPDAIGGSLDGWTILASFRAAVPIALMGTAGAASIWFVARQRGALAPGRETSEVTPPAAGPSRLRPSTLAYGVGAGALAVAVLAATLDPSPYQFATPLPTYLGARQRVEDLRTRLTLARAGGAVRRYRAEHDTFVGFDAEVGASIDAGLLWTDELPEGHGTSEPERWVRVADAARERVDLVLVGGSTTYCLRLSDGGEATYGTAVVGWESERARAALDRCGDRPWTDDLLRPFPIDALCDDAAEIRLCRAVQHVMREILASPTGLS